MKRTRVRKAEARPSAKKREVVSAITAGTLGSLLIEKRLSLNLAIEVRDEFAKFIYHGDVEKLRADPRFTILVMHIVNQESQKATPRVRKVGDRQRYRVQSNKQRQTRYVVVPVSTLEDEIGELAEVDVLFERGRIVIAPPEAA